VTEGEWVPATDAAAHLGPFRVVTGDNPFSQARGDDENASRREELRDLLQQPRRCVRATIARDPTGRWPDEQGFACSTRARPSPPPWPRLRPVRLLRRQRRGGAGARMRRWGVARLGWAERDGDAHVVGLVVTPLVNVPEAPRSPSTDRTASSSAGGPCTCTSDTSARWETLAVLFSRRIASSTSQAGRRPKRAGGARSRRWQLDDARPGARRAPTPRATSARPPR
jgi:hypothetical protein